MNEHLQQYQFLFDNMTHGAFFQDADGRLVEVNQAALEIFGLSRDQFLGRTSCHPDWRVVNEDGTPLLPEQHPSMISLRTGTAVRGFVAGVYNPLQQELVWLEINTTPIFHPGEQLPYRVFATLHDISRLKKTAGALAASEERCRNVINAQSEFVDRYLPGGILTFVNDALCRYAGMTREELLGRSFYGFIHEDDREQQIRLLEGLTTENPTVRTISRAVLPDGNQRWQEWTNHAIFDAEGNLIEYQAVGRDITRQKLAEDALRESEERYRRFIATANEGIGITDPDHIITYVNDRLAEMLGYTPEEMIGMSVTHLLPFDERDGFDEKISERKKGMKSSRECLHQRKDGSEAWLLTSSTPIMDDSGNFQGCFAMFTDLTGRKQAEIALRLAHDQLESRVVERTAALARANAQIKMMSFELVRSQEQERARIAAELHDQVGQSLLLAKMKLDMLSSEIRSDWQRKSADDISALMETSIQDIRTLTFGMRPPLLDTAGIEAALEWLCTSIRKNYNLQTDFSCRCRPITLGVEVRYSLYQAVRELLLNVAKHAGVGRAELSLQIVEKKLVVQVADAGAGFDQPASHLGLAAEGGLGLFNVQQRIGQMGGNFTIVSRPGEGTTVTLSIPLEKTDREKRP